MISEKTAACVKFLHVLTKNDFIIITALVVYIYTGVTVIYTAFLSEREQISTRLD